MKVKKWSSYYLSQERNIVVTNLHIYNFKKKKVRRAIEIKNLAGMTKNLIPNSKEFVIHVLQEPDMRLVSDQ